MFTNSSGIIEKALCGRCASRKVFAVGSVSAQFERCGIQVIAGPNGPKYEVDDAQGVTANVGKGSGYTRVGAYLS